jgi:hypothetical protein
MLAHWGFDLHIPKTNGAEDLHIHTAICMSFLEEFPLEFFASF